MARPVLRGEDFTCPHCGSVYETELHRLPARDSDSATCQVCEKEMDSWSSTAVPLYKLKKRGDGA